MIYSRTVTVEIIQAGQKAPYEDSIYEALIRYTGVNPDGAFHEVFVITQCKDVKSDVRRWIYNFPDNPGPMDPIVDIFHETSPGIWHVRVRVPFND